MTAATTCTSVLDRGLDLPVLRELYGEDYGAVKAANRDDVASTPADEPSAQRRGNRCLRERRQVVDDRDGANRWGSGERFSAVDSHLSMLTTWRTSSPTSRP